MSTKPRTRKYKLVRGGHHVGKTFHEEGSVLELTPRQARALVNKVAPVEAANAPAKAPKQPNAPANPNKGDGGKGDDDQTGNGADGGDGGAE